MDTMILKTKKFSVYASGLIDISNDSYSTAHHNDMAIRGYDIASIRDYGLMNTDDDDEDEDYKYAKLIFTKLYEDILYSDTCNASLLERRSDKAKYSGVLPSTLTYGEINDIVCLHRIFLFLRSEDLLPKHGIFYDLGSGIGRPVFGASLLHPFDKCVGIELLRSLHSMSMEVLNKWTECIEADDKLRSYISGRQVIFIQGSMLDSSSIDWTDGDIVFANSTCFDNNMMQTLHDMSTTMKIGSIFITLSQPLILTSTSIVNENVISNAKQVNGVASWRVIGVNREAMSW